MKLLHIDSSILGDNSVSRELSAAIVATQKALHPDLQVVRHDLATDPLDHLTVAHIGALQGALPEEGALRRDVVAGQNALDEFLNADIVVIGAPMYNFSIPSQLKAWIDRVSVAGRSFRYTENGPEGLAGGKTLFIASSRGGAYGESTGIAFLDHQEAYLRSVFGFLGITDIRFIRAENLARGPELRAQALEAAHGEIEALHGAALAA